MPNFPGTGSSALFQYQICPVPIPVLLEAPNFTRSGTFWLPILTGTDSSTFLVPNFSGSGTTKKQNYQDVTLCFPYCDNLRWKLPTRYVRLLFVSTPSTQQSPCCSGPITKITIDTYNNNHQWSITPWPFTLSSPCYSCLKQAIKSYKKNNKHLFTLSMQWWHRFHPNHHNGIIPGSLPFLEPCI